MRIDTETLSAISDMVDDVSRELHDGRVCDEDFGQTLGVIRNAVDHWFRRRRQLRDEMKELSSPKVVEAADQRE